MRGPPRSTGTPVGTAVAGRGEGTGGRGHQIRNTSIATVVSWKEEAGEV